MRPEVNADAPGASRSSSLAQGMRRQDEDSLLEEAGAGSLVDLEGVKALLGSFVLAPPKLIDVPVAHHCIGLTRQNFGFPHAHAPCACGNRLRRSARLRRHGEKGT